MTPADAAAHSSTRLARLRSGSGPRIARLYQIALAWVLIVAWVSLGSQIQLLIGSRGLLPIAPLVERAWQLNPSVWLQFPSWLLWNPSDTALTTGVVLGIVLALAVLVGLAPRLCFFLSAILYLGYTVAGQDFTAFQWDNLLVESCLLAACLPRSRRAPVAHTLMRLLLFKVYFESGIAKAQSHLGDWFDGTAMSFYYETAPLPAWPGWYAHHLPEAWHTLESWGAMSLELVGAFLILGPRRARLAALLGFTAFQVLNLATANYGYFVYITLALHLFLLDDRDIERMSRWLRAHLPARGLPWNSSWRPRPFPVVIPRIIRNVVFSSFVVAWIFVSITTGISHFVRNPSPPVLAQKVENATRNFRFANAYHLFGHITRERIEPEFQAQVQGVWRSLPLHYKPGDPNTPPPFVAPHQPRLDFLLWFYGLGYQRPMPRYVANLLQRLCTDPESVQPFFLDPLPAHPEAVRIQFWKHHYTSSDERRLTGAWWTRESLTTLRSLQCTDVRMPALSSGRRLRH